MRTAVVFDLFHTLVDTEHLRPPGFRTVDAVGEVIGAQPDRFAAFWATSYAERETSMLELVDLVGDYCMLVGIDFDDHTRREVDALFGRCRDDALRFPEPAMAELIAELATRSSIGVLSNCDVREVREWDASPYAEHVDVFGRSCEIGVMKPDVGSYRWVLERLGVRADEATFVGNGASNELDGARAAGFGRIIHCNIFDAVNGLATPLEQQQRARQADLSVNSIGELAAALADTDPSWATDEFSD
ncbi:MAG: HAD family hydrolase [Actinomycetota bacterium]